MHANAEVLLVILGMALVTYATRIGGLLLVSRIQLGRRSEAVLRLLPGTILVAIVAPTVLNGGLAELVAAVAAVLVAARSKSLPLAMAAGVLVVVVLRQWS
jgi:uncharacterized membrane protein